MRLRTAALAVFLVSAAVLPAFALPIPLSDSIGEPFRQIQELAGTIKTFSSLL